MLQKLLSPILVRIAVVLFARVRISDGSDLLACVSHVVLDDLVVLLEEDVDAGDYGS